MTHNERLFCQSCGMPLDAPEHRAQQADGTQSREYCIYCYKDGDFTAPEMTMEEMIAWNLEFNEKNGHPFGTQEEAKQMMESWFPTLGRWKKQ